MHNIPHTEEAKIKMSNSHKGIPLTYKRRPTKKVNDIILYRCSKCHEFKQYEEFYKNKRTILGITSECKKCHCKTSIETRNKDNARDKNKEFARIDRIQNLEKYRERERSRERKKDEKYDARRILNNAIKNGTVIKPAICEECRQEKRLTGHHDDYSKPLKIKWLCYECHGILHRKN